MNYQDFICYVQNGIQKQLGPHMEVTLHQVTKNNSIHLDGLTITTPQEIMSPTIYLNSYYDNYQNHGQSLSDIIDEIKRIYEKSRCGPVVEPDFYTNFEKAGRHVVCKLISYSRNLQLLEKIPFIPFLDLAIVFYYLFEDETIGNSSILVHHSHLKLWNITPEELYKIARQNTPRLLLPDFRSMEHVISDILGDDLFEEDFSDSLPMYVLSNETKNYGAVLMIYDYILSEIGQQLGSDYYILPSSIHECIIVPSTVCQSRKDLQDMVREINETQVLPEDILSDHVYYYECDTHKLND